MILNKIVLPIKADMSYVQGAIPILKLTANTSNRDLIYVISPAQKSDIVRVNFEDELGGKEVTTAYLELTDIKVSEIVNVDRSYYELIKDWNVWSAYIPSKALTFVSGNRPNGVGVSVSIKGYVVPKIPPHVDFKGELLNVEDIVGEGAWVVKTTLLEYDNIEFGFNDLLIISGGETFRKRAIETGGKTTTLNYSVDPSVKDTEVEVYEFNLVENLIALTNDTRANQVFTNQRVDSEVDRLDGRIDNVDIDYDDSKITDYVFTTPGLLADGLNPLNNVDLQNISDTFHPEDTITISNIKIGHSIRLCINRPSGGYTEYGVATIIGLNEDEAVIETIVKKFSGSTLNSEFQFLTIGTIIKHPDYPNNIYVNTTAGHFSLSNFEDALTENVIRSLLTDLDEIIENLEIDGGFL